MQSWAVLSRRERKGRGRVICAQSPQRCRRPHPPLQCQTGRLGLASALNALFFILHVCISRPLSSVFVGWTNDLCEPRSRQLSCVLSDLYPSPLACRCGTCDLAIGQYCWTDRTCHDMRRYVDCYRDDFRPLTVDCRCDICHPR